MQLQRPSSLDILVELTLLLRGGVLVLLVLGHKVVHVGLGLGELHFVHDITSVEESLAVEHGSELLRHALPELLDGGGVVAIFRPLGGMSNKYINASTYVVIRLNQFESMMQKTNCHFS